MYKNFLSAPRAQVEPSIYSSLTLTMASKFALLSNLLLASVVLAAPSSRLEARLARRRENRRSQLINRIDSPAGIVSNVDYSSNWAGAVWDEADVRIIPLIYDHPQSHAFSDRELSPL